MPYTLIAPQTNGVYTVNSAVAAIAGTIMERDSQGNFAANNGTFAQVIINTRTAAVAASQTSNFNVNLNSEVWPANCTSNAVTATLLPANTNVGLTQKFIKTDSSGNHYLLSCGAGDSVQGSSSLALTSQWSEATLTSIGSNTWIEA
jgi:hypothetical protein